MNSDAVQKVVLAVLGAAMIGAGGWVLGTASRVTRIESKQESQGDQVEKLWQRSGDRITYHEIVDILKSLSEQRERDMNKHDTRFEELEKDSAYRKGFEAGIRFGKETLDK